MTTLVLIAGAALAALHLSIKHGLARTAVVIALTLMSLPSITLFSVGDRPNAHFGIAPPIPTITLMVLSVAVARLLIRPTFPRWPDRLTLLFGLMSAAAHFVFWENTPAQQSGLLLYVLAMVAFTVGSWAGNQQSLGYKLLLARAATFVILLHLFAAVAQFLGLTLGLPGGEWLSQGRMVGLYNHPSVLGKNIFVLMALMLPAAVSSCANTRRTAYFGIGAGTIATLLTLSRANSLAIVLSLALFLLLHQERRTASRLALLGTLVATLGIARGSVAGLLERQADDATGGYRSQILKTGLAVVEDNWITGLGPNSYSAVVGQFDSFAARGFPVHNTFLLVVAEIGLPLAALFFLPILAVIIPLRRGIATKKRDPTSSAAIAMTPGLLIITMTGWGMASIATLPLWFFCYGTLLRSRGLVAEPEVIPARAGLRLE